MECALSTSSGGSLADHSDLEDRGSPTLSTEESSVEVILEGEDEHFSSDMGIHTSEEDSSEEEGHRRVFITSSAVLMSIPGNQKCFDCTIDHPLWVNVSYGIFLCAPCATIHSEFGLSVKPLSDQCLTIEELTLMARTGNRVASLYWLVMCSHENMEFLHPHSPKDTRTKFIVEKYRGKWLHPVERARLAAEQHAFSSQPATSYDSLIAQTQHLSLGSNDVNGYAVGQGYNYGANDNLYNLASYTNENGYSNGLDYDNSGGNVLANGMYANGTKGIIPTGMNGKELAATPSFVMSNTAVNSRKIRGKHRQSY